MFHLDGQIDTETTRDGANISHNIDKLDHDLVEMLGIMRSSEEFDILTELSRFFRQMHGGIFERVVRVDSPQHILELT